MAGAALCAEVVGSLIACDRCALRRSLHSRRAGEERVAEISDFFVAF